MIFIIVKGISMVTKTETESTRNVCGAFMSSRAFVCISL